MAQVNKLLMEKRVEEAELLTLRLIAAGDATCLDGAWRTGWSITGLGEPAWNRWSQLDLSALRKAHATSRLVSEAWVAVETQRLRDAQFLMKQRPGGGGDNREKEKEPGAKGGGK